MDEKQGQFRDIYFDSSVLAPPQPSYVCWLDVMGSQNMMSTSLVASANFICKLHIAVLEANIPECSLYPMLDGLYITAERQRHMLSLLTATFSRIAHSFCCAKEHRHRFIVKASLAYGPVLHGRNIPSGANRVLGANEGHKSSILIGIPVIQAFGGERHAPPFGIFIHESARSFAPSGDRPLPYVLWRWFDRIDEDEARRLESTLGEYYAWCRDNADLIGYSPDRIEQHSRMARAYLGGNTQPRASQ